MTTNIISKSKVGDELAINVDTKSVPVEKAKNVFQCRGRMFMRGKKRLEKCTVAKWQYWNDWAEYVV